MTVVKCPTGMLFYAFVNIMIVIQSAIRAELCVCVSDHQKYSKKKL